MLFKDIEIDCKNILDKYFDLVDYEACEYCFTTLYMWKDLYNTKYYVEDDFAVVAGEYENKGFIILPLAKKENMNKAFDFIIKNFEKQHKQINLKAINKEVVEYLKSVYGDRFEYIEERNNFDYIYDGESLRTLAGRKNQKKRNHLNSFVKEYGDRVEYKKLEEADFDECISLLKEWSKDKEESIELDSEFKAIKRIFKNYEKLKDTLKISGIYIDSKLEAFSIGEMLNDNMAVIHVEKANADIRGLYPYINQQFLLNEFSDVEFVNREEDLGIEGLRKAKLSYHPVKFAEKYTVIEK
ncbi:phosphatidylglycerol lysyltransferase domain-containing protein [Paraclostridium bifermentans]|uniref:Phosphatidylglycerol lysyltransferase domain-containing protein n=1 Tax=Paraclostridium bifermentans TaxID=1490 RepID=A0ABY8R8M3_PARBF|nr:phosphatidylglycerol lysyltransferase domain-containing protein [Paraclostridium bifermentans]